VRATALLLAVAGCRGGAPSSADHVAANNCGVGLMGQFDFAQARTMFADLATAHPDRTDLQLNLSVATLNRQQEGDDRDAQQSLQRVLSADPQNLRAHYSLGLVLLNDGRAADALPHFTTVAERNPDDPYAAYYVGRAKFQTGDVAGALAAYERALALSPRLRSGAYGSFQALQRLYRDERLPVRVTTDGNEDVTRALAHVDGVAAPPGRVDGRYIGLTAARSLTLDFGEALDAVAGDPLLVPTARSNIPPRRRCSPRGRHTPTITRRRSRHAAPTGTGR